MTRPITQRLAQLATAGAVAAFAWSLAHHHPDPSTAAESGFLALLLGITLTALALSSRTAPAVVPGGALIALALCLPAAEGTRGALVMVLLVATVAFATWRTLAVGGRVAFLDFAALAIAWQGIARSERLFEWQGISSHSLIWLLAFPLAAAAAAWWHSRSHGGTNTLILLAAICTLAPGLGVVTVAVLVATAALTGERGRSWQAAAVAAGACVVALWWLPAVGPALLVLVAVLALRHFPVGAWLPVAGALAWAVATIVATGGSFQALGWLLLALPLAALAPAATRTLLLAALALALAHGPGAEPTLLAPALALAVLAMPRERSARRLQAGWSLTLLAFASVTAAYPWLRHPLAEPTPGLWPLALGAGAVALGYLVVQRAAQWRAIPLWRTAMVLLGVIALIAAWRQPQRHNVEPIVLTSEQDTWESVPAAGTLGTLTVDSLLSGGHALRPGQPVAYLLLTAAGGSQQRLVLRYGQHTADWSARRQRPVAGEHALQMPSVPPWLTWYAGAGSLAQRYRATWRLDQPVAAERLALVRAHDLAPEVELTILSVATR